jgi:hypothetical protein
MLIPATRHPPVSRSTQQKSEVMLISTTSLLFSFQKKPRDTASTYVLTMLGVRKISNSCLETDSDLFLNNQPRTGMRDK